MLVSKSTLIGVIAIVVWSTLALFTVLSGSIPPFQLLAIAFSVAFLLGCLGWYKKGVSELRKLRQPWYVWVVGVGGLFGYHLFYFLAIKHAPAMEANLINYLWPLLIVLFSTALPGGKLRWYHLGGALLGFLGAGVLIVKDMRSFSIEAAYMQGYTYALIAALLWSSYSVLSRRFESVPTSVVGGFCGVVMVLAWGAHLWWETSVMPSTVELLAAIMLGLGPVGGAFYVWDVGMKHGDIKLLGALAYAAPLLSTLLLIALGLAQGSTQVWIACGLIIAGSLLSSKEYFSRLRRL
jgi:drug/metabolite transporter (DMT)-like permease